jgi:hypothetical protein
MATTNNLIFFSISLESTTMAVYEKYSRKRKSRGESGRKGRTKST